ncbi:hypothetical protein J416_12552 [Gracilibacillus halophilus YIM-C55.5]|uniref:Methyltransferase domain-containing protein n=1 Tax=Gracilibacillus halophilus YIM-C55.5 TaxID=1308866 RepID=N4WJ03_9BACI|nr:tRNA1(Val) (adenine(37)-N6)-methyltransferase [Gracilibacillus halophilus]ENH96112.1 hypothetical protein J416_12552 [Gracilibacillus halophilus YIM-C55.5]
MDAELFGDERMDDLLAEENLKIIQSSSVFAFSLDAVLLANFASIPRTRGKILDLCTGNGVIPLLLSQKSQVPITGVEIQSKLYDMAHRNVTLNGLSEQITMIEGDLREMPAYFQNDTFDLVTVNPPYFPTKNQNHWNKNDYLTIARHEIYCDLEDVVKACSKLVRPGGRVAMVHRPSRFVEILTLLRSYKIEPKRLRFVYPKMGKEANMLLIEGIRDGKPDVTILPPLYAYTDQDQYTSELKEILYGTTN